MPFNFRLEITTLNRPSWPPSYQPSHLLPPSNLKDIEEDIERKKEMEGKKGKKDKGAATTTKKKAHTGGDGDIVISARVGLQRCGGVGCRGDGRWRPRRSER